MNNINKEVIERKFDLITDVEINTRYRKLLSKEQLENLILEFDNAKFNLFRQEKELMNLRSQLRHLKNLRNQNLVDLNKAEDLADEYKIKFEIADKNFVREFNRNIKRENKIPMLSDMPTKYEY